MFAKIVQLIKSNSVFVKHNLFSYTVLAINIISAIYAVRENLEVLGKERYAVWILAYSAITLLGMLHFGFSSIVIFRYAEFKKNDTLAAFFGGNIFVLALQIVLTVLILSGVAFFDSYLIQSALYRGMFKQILFLALPGLVLSSVSAYLEALLYYNFKLIYKRNIIDFLRVGFMNFLLVFALDFSGDILVMPIVYTIVMFVTFLFSLFSFLKKQNIVLRKNEIKPKYMLHNFKDAISFWILWVSSFVITQTDVFFISTFKNDVGLVTMYAQSFRLQDIALKFIKKITDSKAPKVFGLFQEGKHLAVVGIYKKLLWVNVLLSILACVSISLLGKYVLEFWLDNMIEFDQKLIVVLSLICITGSIHWVLWNFCTLTGLQKTVKYVVLVEILLNLSLSYSFIRYFGLFGLGLASLLSNAVTIVFVFRLFLKYSRQHKVVNVS